MSTKIERASLSAAEASSEPEEASAPQTVKPLNAGIGVFRALILTVLYYIALGSVIWLAWQGWQHWHAR